MRRALFLCLFLVVSLSGSCPAESRLKDPGKGKAVYKKFCGDCHGSQGEGVKGEYNHALHGDLSVVALSRYISKNMPDGDPHLVVKKDADAVAAYIYDAFYSPEAWARLHPPEISFSRLTIDQFNQSVSDLVAGKQRQSKPIKTGGIKGRYTLGKGKSKLPPTNRVDEIISFDFNEPGVFPVTHLRPKEGEAPQAGQNKFRALERRAQVVSWSGAVYAPESGEYDFTVISKNGYTLWVNDKDSAVIDHYTRSPGQSADRASVKVTLLAGRLYFLRLNFSKVNEAESGIELRWKRPHRVEEVIPARYLAETWVPSVFVNTRKFPADDSSVGYARGTSVSFAWQEAVALSALDAAAYVVKHLNALAGVGAEQKGQRPKLVHDYCLTLASRAYRRTLSSSEKEWVKGMLIRPACQS